MVETTGGFTSAQLALEAQTLVLPSLSHAEAIEIGEIAAGLGRDRALPIAVEVRLGEWIVFISHCLEQNQKMIGGLRVKHELLWQREHRRCLKELLPKKLA